MFNFGSPVWRIAAALVLVAAVGAWLLSQWPQPVSAQEIVRRAQASLNSPLAAGLQSYFIAEQTTLWAPTEAGSGANAAPPVQSHSEIRRWFQAPDKWRLESTGETYAADGKPAAGSRWQSVVVSDGSDQYDYDALGNVQTINLAPSFAGRLPACLCPQAAWHGSRVQPGAVVRAYGRLLPANRHRQCDRCGPVGLRGRPRRNPLPVGCRAGDERA